MATNLDTSQSNPQVTQNSPDIAHKTTKDISKKPLKPTYALFVQHYILTKNASESARRAGYSANSASVTGCVLLRKPRIREEIERLQAKQLQAVEAQVSEIVERDITREHYLTIAQNAYDEVGPKHSNAPSYLTIIGKVKAFFGDIVNNNMFLNLQSPEFQQSIDSGSSALAKRLARIEKSADKKE